MWPRAGTEMMQADHIQILFDEWREYRERRLPRSIEGTGIDGDAQISLYEEDGYLAGLVTSFLGIHPMPSTLAHASRDEARIEAIVRGDLKPRPFSHDAIRLNRSIDTAIEKAAPTSSTGRDLLRQWVEYQHGMLRLASALSIASQVPIAYADPPEREQGEC